MTVTHLIATLAVLTLAAVAVFALVSKRRVEARRRDPEAPKSTLAADAPDSRGGGR